MPGCLNKCPSYAGSTTYSGVWYVIRDHFGPRPESMSESYRFDTYEQDLEEYFYWVDAWNTAHGGLVDTLDRFGKWLIWRLSMGTSEYGNLPVNKVHNHIGISCIPCPYDDIIISPDVRSELWIGSVPTTRAAHGDYYMKVAVKGSSWGFACTYPGCPYAIDNGYPYFHV